MSAAVNGVFKGETINLDGKHFANSTFENCVLVFAGGELPIVTGCALVDCEWRFDGAAARTCEFLANLCQRLGSEGRALAEEVFEKIRSFPLPPPSPFPPAVAPEAAPTRERGPSTTSARS